MQALSRAEIRRLRELRRERGARDREGVLLAEGVHLAEEALRSSAPIEMAVVSPRLSPELLAALERAGAPLRTTSDATLESLQDARSPQPVLLVVRRRAARLDEVLRGRGGPALVPVLVDVQDPGNLGSILRTADAAGATGFLGIGGADLHHPRAVRGTMGSIFRLPAVSVPDAATAFAALRTAGVRLVATTAGAPRSHLEVDLRGPTALVLGGEGSGLSPALLEAADEIVRIPMQGGVESLSVPAAAAVLLYEAVRQRQATLR